MLAIEEIQELALKSGFQTKIKDGKYPIESAILKLVRLVEKAEREACAKLCEDRRDMQSALAIRSRGND